jgi:sugar O-acyltransferase (sialic acid O-acetyltransferase NeuD family)
MKQCLSLEAIWTLAMDKNIFIYGAGGHAKVVIDAARQQGKSVQSAFDDDAKRAGKALLGCLVLGGRDELQEHCARLGQHAGIVAIGKNGVRASVAHWLEEAGFILTTIIHPDSSISEGVEVGRGTVIMAGGVINADALLGSNVIVNTSATIDHDCVIGDHVHIAPGSHICGDVNVGSNVLIGAGSVVCPGVKIGDGAIIGAGSTVIHDVPANMTVVGSPCRPIARREA